MAVKATMGDMHMMLMEQMERLCNADAEDMRAEIARTEAMAEIGKAVVSNASLMLKMHKMAASGDAPKMLTTGEV